MRIIKNVDLSQTTEGTVKIHIDDDEDMWHLYNIIKVGDLAGSVCFRKVVHESSTGSTSSETLRLFLTVRIEAIEWDRDTCSLRIKGVNTTDNPHIRIGQYHTMEIKSGMDISITKSDWDQQHLEVIHSACDPTTTADVAAVVMHAGLANVCFITKYMTMVKAKVELSIPKKRAGPSGHDKAMQRFYELTAQAIHKNIPLPDISCLIMASPAFIADEFMKYLTEYAKTNGWKDLTSYRSKIKLVHSASGHVHALNQVLKDESVSGLIADTTALEESKTMQTFLSLLNTDPDKAYYGLDHVKKAIKMNAVDTLLISDALFRSNDVKVRRLYVDLVDVVKTNNAKSVVFSAANVSGEQLTQLTGIAAILRYSVPYLDDEEEEELLQQTVTRIGSMGLDEDGNVIDSSKNNYYDDEEGNGDGQEKKKKEKKEKKDKKEKKEKKNGDKYDDDVMYF